jgi:hypothetical protein
VGQAEAHSGPVVTHSAGHCCARNSIECWLAGTLHQWSRRQAAGLAARCAIAGLHNIAAKCVAGEPSLVQLSIRESGQLLVHSCSRIVVGAGLDPCRYIRQKSAEPRARRRARCAAQFAIGKGKSRLCGHDGLLSREKTMCRRCEDRIDATRAQRDRGLNSTA